MVDIYVACPGTQATPEREVMPVVLVAQVMLAPQEMWVAMVIQEPLLLGFAKPFLAALVATQATGVLRAMAVTQAPQEVLEQRVMVVVAGTVVLLEIQEMAALVAILAVFRVVTQVIPFLLYPVLMLIEAVLAVPEAVPAEVPVVLAAVEL
jgi:hypothetical protein